MRKGLDWGDDGNILTVLRERVPFLNTYKTVTSLHMRACVLDLISN